MTKYVCNGCNREFDNHNDVFKGVYPPDLKDLKDLEDTYFCISCIKFMTRGMYEEELKEFIIPYATPIPKNWGYRPCNGYNYEKENEYSEEQIESWRKILESKKLKREEE